MKGKVKYLYERIFFYIFKSFNVNKVFPTIFKTPKEKCNYLRIKYIYGPNRISYIMSYDRLHKIRYRVCILNAVGFLVRECKE